MRKIILFFILAVVFASTSLASQDDPPYYFARCNLKILKGKLINWVNWQSAPEFLPVNTKVTVRLSGRKAFVVDIQSKRTFILDMGAVGPQYLAKFFVSQPVKIKDFPEEVQGHIANAVARIGMTKEQVYIAMGMPAWIPSGNSNIATYEQIIASDLWVYKRRRFGKNIGVKFDPQTGLVNHTEGIWR
jgi:hypothetical protein